MLKGHVYRAPFFSSISQDIWGYVTQLSESTKFFFFPVENYSEEISQDLPLKLSGLPLNLHSLTQNFMEAVQGKQNVFFKLYCGMVTSMLCPLFSAFDGRSEHSTKSIKL